ncbi:MAG: hypothetical protein WA208_07090 [Thermoanaerobaculia bacterium]
MSIDLTQPIEFHVLTVGWSSEVIRSLGDPIQDATGFRFSHILDPALDEVPAEKQHQGTCFVFREDFHAAMPLPDREALADLERPGVPTIHTMIMSDRVVKNLAYDDAVSYVSFLARRLEELFLQIRPTVVIGGFDSVHSAIGLAVARKLGLPWFALNFTSLPLGRAGFCTTLSPRSSFSCLPSNPQEMRALALSTLADFENKRTAVPAYLSANSIAMVLRRLPGHLAALARVFRRVVQRRFDRYTQYSIRRLAADYVRKRLNLLLLPAGEFVDAPPAAPYLFFGLHMQPESSIDVWAPFFSDQFSVVEAMARSTPPTHKLFVKLHKSDADNYSRRELERMSSLPGVKLVSPFANSRPFIDNASLVLAIQGNIALEAGLLGRPVLMFGDSPFLDLPSVSKVKRITDLPAQIRMKLAEAPPDREAIVDGFASYLGRYGPGCYNNWDIKPSHSEIQDLAAHFVALRDFLASRADAGAPVAPREEVSHL